MRWDSRDTFPGPETLAGEDLSGLGLTRARERAVAAFARAVADGEVRLDRSVGLDELVTSLLSVPGLGPWTAHYVALRLGEPDAFPATDLGVRRFLDAVPGSAGDPLDPGERWRPWRALATVHLWAAAAVPPGPNRPRP